MTSVEAILDVISGVDPNFGEFIIVVFIVVIVVFLVIYGVSPYLAECPLCKRYRVFHKTGASRSERSFFYLEFLCQHCGYREWQVQPDPDEQNNWITASRDEADSGPLDCSLMSRARTKRP